LVKDTAKNRKAARHIVDYFSHEEVGGPYRRWSLIGINNSGTKEGEAEARWEWGLGSGSGSEASYFKFMKIDAWIHLVCDWHTSPSAALRTQACSADWDVSSKAATAGAEPAPKQESAQVDRGQGSGAGHGMAAQEAWDPSAPPLVEAVAVDDMDRGGGEISLGGSDVKLYEEPGPSSRLQRAGGPGRGGGSSSAGDDSDEEYYYGPRDPPHLRSKSKNQSKFAMFTALSSCCLYVVGCCTCVGLLVGQTGGAGARTCRCDADAFTDLLECNCCDCDCDGCCCCF